MASRKPSGLVITKATPSGRIRDRARARTSPIWRHESDELNHRFRCPPEPPRLIVRYGGSVIRTEIEPAGRAAMASRASRFSMWTRGSMRDWPSALIGHRLQLRETPCGQQSEPHLHSDGSGNGGRTIGCATCVRNGHTPASEAGAELR